MIIIAHRGNINGPNTAVGGENTVAAIKHALAEGYDVEIDVLDIDDNGIFYLGHDVVDEMIDYHSGFNRWIFQSRRIILHGKTFRAATKLLKMKQNYQIYNDFFFHNTDKFALTDIGWLWMYPNPMEIFDPTLPIIDVLPEIYEKRYYKDSLPLGICTDFPELYNKEYN